MLAKIKKKLKKFFTPARRKALYGLVAAGSAALVAFGVVTQDQLDATTQSVVSAITALSTLLAFINTDTEEEL